MKQVYKFFDNFITTELDLDLSEQQEAHDMLSAMDVMYKVAGHVEGAQNFIKLRELIEKSRDLHEEINLFVVPEYSLSTGAHWDPYSKSLKVEQPNSNRYSKFLFARGLIFELCNSINKCFSVNNISLIASVADGNLNLDAFLTELAEYNTDKMHEDVIISLFQDVNKFLQGNDDKIINLLTLIGIGDYVDKFLIINRMKIFSEYAYAEHNMEPSFIECWDNVNSHESSGNRGYSHADMYRGIAKTPNEIELNKIYITMIEQIKNNTFDLELTKQSYSHVLKKAAEQDELIKAEYYVLYETIMQEGKKLEDLDLDLGGFKENINYFFELSFIIVQIFRLDLNLIELSDNDKKFIFLIFDIIDCCNNLPSLIDMSYIIAKQFIPQLKQIQELNNIKLIEVHTNLVASFENLISCQHKKQLTPEVMELVQSADGYRSMWRHQTEHYLFKYNKLTQQFTVAFAFGDQKRQFKPICEFLDSENNRYKYDDSLKRICYR